MTALRGFRQGAYPARFEYLNKDARMEVRLPRDQLDALKEAARQQGVPYTRLVRQFIDQGMRSLRVSSHQ